MTAQSPPATYYPDEVAVALCIYGAELDPIQITKLLGVEPTHSHKRGERETLRRPPWEKGAWILEVRRFEPIDPDSMFNELLAGLPTDEEVWSTLAASCQLRVDFALHTDAGATFELAPEVVQRISRLRASFQIYIQAYGDNDA